MLTFLKRIKPVIRAGRRLERQKEFNELADALKSGDLSSAQQAYSAWQQLFGTSAGNSQTQTGQQDTAKNSVTADISTLGQALQSGDLTAAQTDFTQMQTDIQTLGKGRHHHHHKASASTQDTATAATSNSGTDLDQLLAAIGVQKDSSTDTSGSIAGLQQWLNTLTTIQGLSGKKVDLQGLQALVGNMLNVSA